MTRIPWNISDITDVSSAIRSSLCRPYFRTRRAIRETGNTRKSKMPMKTEDNCQLTMNATMA